MLLLFPFLAWLAVIVSAGLLAALWWLGELQPRGLVLLVAWLLAAVYCQFFSGSGIVAAAGLLCQTILAIYLVLRWKLSS